MYEQLDGKKFETTPKQTGWKRVVTFSKWEKNGKSRLYANYVDYDRQGKQRNHNSLNGYVDLTTNEIVGPVSFRVLLNEVMK